MDKYLEKSSSTGNLSAKRPAETEEWSIPKRTALPKDQSKYDANRQITVNRFASLPKDTPAEEPSDSYLKASTTVKKSGHVPPMIMDLKEDCTHGQIMTLVGKYTKRFHLKYMGNNKVAINCYTPEAHQAVKDGLLTDNAPFRTYTRKDERTPKVVIKGLPACVENDLNKELEDLGFPGTKISKLKSAKTNELPYPPFLVQLPAGADLRKFRQIRYIFNCVVEIQKFKPKRSVLQCYRCQRFGHSSRNCNMPPRCVKCPVPHATVDCPKKTDEPAICCNCNEQHPANAPKCRSRLAYLERLDKIKAPAKKTPNVSTRTLPISQPAVPITSDTGASSSSWAAAVKNAPVSPRCEQPTIEQSESAVGEMLSILKVIQNLKQQFQSCTSMIDKVVLVVTHLGHYV
jgi:hypothetical protein